MQLVEFSKSFGGSTTPTGTAVLTFTIANLDSVNPASGLAFSDNLDEVVPGLVATGLPVLDVCGTGSQMTGTSFLAVTGASLPPGGDCSFNVTVAVPVTATTGSFLNTTSGLSSWGLPVAGPATAALTVEPLVGPQPEADISVTKDDGVTSAVPGKDTITYTMTVANAGPSGDSSVAVADVFPSTLACSWTSVAAGGATGNSASSGAALADTLAMPVGSSVTYTATCSIDPSATGTLSNTVTATGSLTDPNPANNAATDSNTVLADLPTIPVPDTTGLFDPATGQWYLLDSAGNVTTFAFGDPNDIPFVGDSNGDGIQTPGLYRQSSGVVYLRNSNTAGLADISFVFGNPDDIPLAGDWDGDGDDTVSVYRSSNQTFYVTNRLGAGGASLGPAESSFVFGDPGDNPFAGDFDGDGDDAFGLHRSDPTSSEAGSVYFRNSLSGGEAEVTFVYGNPGDKMFSGDWDGNVTNTPGVFRSSDAKMFLRNSNSTGIADIEFFFGEAGWLPVAGRFGLG